MQHIKVAVDAVVFGYFDKEDLQILLIKRKIEPFKGSWALPGGLVLDDEDLDDAVKRELYEEAGIKPDFLEQLYSFGNVGRDPRNRVVSVAYLGLVNPSYFELFADSDAEDAQWFSIHKLPQLAFDHQKIIDTALKRLRTKIQYQPVGFNLLNEEFPFSDLENLYKAIIGQEIDRRNFRKKIMSYGLLNETNNFKKEGSGRPGKMFTFNQEKYKALEEQGFYFEIKLI
ncbi:NUDIX hydrolase [Elizabethkingia meningoseptica]|uniref:NUDIX hydrolase n=1 Tax=Elizabethkingia meningoseptica TaxID=238 RepID=A0A1V3TWX3_ELIME|nr:MULTISPECIES: NUDIX domain-containing protein [Elizabethkingia]AQX04388.1 NUDIX hydrolase [Elizabethkingia meningoseptica]AQX11852.1 NUDIX hydrolase [Elizabethkingia meningoseptica]AQX46429.1 NUDIX hydrolase [Elizabethkingia meningoseptica]EOR31619.1 nudix hydrolase [Elizabethkingia meningoseptica ATCC 13253 = NBRC 12535]KUY18945.1 NUDIX hydrolase [Elizabethkingia meningoseptica]